MREHFESIFLYSNKIKICHIFIVDIDDILITSIIEALNNKLHTLFPLKDFYNLNFITIKVFHVSNGIILLNQTNYIQELLSKVKLFNATSITTPLTLKPLWCVWMRQFKRVIHLFGEFEILCNEMLCLDGKIKKHLKCIYFFEVFQLAKLEEIQIP